MDYGTKIYELRKQKALSQEEVANKLGVSRQSISLWETNQASPSMDNLISIAKLFSVSLDELVGLKRLEKIDQQNEDEPICIIDYTEDKHVVYRRDYMYLNSKADTIMFFISCFFLLFALLSFLSALRMEIEVAKIALIIGFISNMIGLILYPLYMQINIMKKVESRNNIHIEFYNDYITYRNTYCLNQVISFEMINYYIAKKDYLLVYLFKGMRIYIPKKDEYDLDVFLSKKVERRKNKKPFWK